MWQGILFYFIFIIIIFYLILGSGFSFSFVKKELPYFLISKLITKL